LSDIIYLLPSLALLHPWEKPIQNWAGFSDAQDASVLLSETKANGTLREREYQIALKSLKTPNIFSGGARFGVWSVQIELLRISLPKFA
jgi:hypothetical protein